MTNDLFNASFLNGTNALFVGQLYVSYLEDSSSVDASWRQFFESLGSEESHALKELVGASWAPRVTGFTNGKEVQQFSPSPTFTQVSSEQVQQQVLDSIRALMLIRSYRVRGHLVAALDPLGLQQKTLHPELDPGSYGFKEGDYDRPIFIDGVLGKRTATLREILKELKRAYASFVGIEFMHIQDPEKKSWLQQRIENTSIHYGSEIKKQIYTTLLQAEGFEKFLAVKYPGAKRFGLEGGESMMAALRAMIETSAEHGVQEVVLGMAHRGRLNVLANLIGLPCHLIFSGFQGKSLYAEDVQGSGDVKYHLGASGDQEFQGKSVHLSLTSNPSHLESVNPVVVGRVRAKQARLKEDQRASVLGLLIHGDAAFVGQGIVAETFLLSNLEGYQTEGTLHLVINNQIGFTTSPIQSRSSVYCSDLAKTIQAPVLHVNGDQPEAVAYAAHLAADYRQVFKSDIVLDLFCYRRHGHNEMDEPSYTQPLMYQKIRDQKSLATLYAEKLMQEKVLSEDEIKTLEKTYSNYLEKEFERSKENIPAQPDWLQGAWSGIQVSSQNNIDIQTGVNRDQLLSMGNVLTSLPEGFVVHPRLERVFNEKKKMFERGEGFDWATAEALAFGSLLCEGNPVRLSGQDSGRGTFSQRHGVLTDQKTAESYVPLNALKDKKAALEIIDSPLAEASVLGFEFGYSLVDPHTLVLWEAQFGDFANGAQVMVDQYITSSEAKWLRMSGLVMLLPHGYEGQGPEHSSARLERYLQMCAEENIQVVNCTTPANYFHVLRRQMRRPIRKPLIVMTPKSLLRNPLAVSSLKDMEEGTSFQKVLSDPLKDLKTPEILKRIVLCSGKIYYDLWQEREKRQINNIALIRLEQLYPFPAEELKKVLASYQNAEFIWCQEEPENMGAWTFVDRRLERVLKELGMKNNRPLYKGRPESAATATGFPDRHLKEQAQILEEVLSI